ncbi:hypothetical protein IM538_08885 [Cytobacillus suaedae]|nr:hypothetical protein IM538_08885 [Cytobacillus suaedae]
MRHSDKEINALDLMTLYENVGWWQERKESDIAEMLKQVTSVGAWQDNTLIRFARAITDGHFRAYIEMLLSIKPDSNTVGPSLSYIKNNYKIVTSFPASICWKVTLI